MKYRADFVTNSSSSSFVVAKDSVKDKKELRKLLYKLYKQSLDSDDCSNKKEIKRCAKAYYHITKLSKKHPYEYNGCIYNKHYLVDNGDTIRYSRYEVNKFFDNQGIDIKWTYCD